MTSRTPAFDSTGVAHRLKSGRKTKEPRISQQAREESDEQFRLLIDGVKEYAIYMLDSRGQVVSWNSGATRIEGYSSDEIVGKNFSLFYRAADIAAGKPDRELRQSAANGRFEEEAWRVRKDGSAFWAHIVITPMYDESHTLRGFSKITRDITERRAWELEIQRLNEELEQRVAMRTAQLKAANQELEAFTYSVSHDLRAPLRHISGFSRLLVEDFGSQLQPDAKRYVERISDGVRKMGVLVDELLNLAGIGRHALSAKSTQLNPVVLEVINILGPETEGRDVEWKIADLGCVNCDPILMGQVFQNLIANALKFTRPRATAVIEIGRFEGDPTFFVRDNGVGFDMKYADKLFGVFQRLHHIEDFEGTGIGLATVKIIIQKHDGRVWAEAEPGKGAAFYFTVALPVQLAIDTNIAAMGAQA